MNAAATPHEQFGTALHPLDTPRRARRPGAWDPTLAHRMTARALAAAYARLEDANRILDLQVATEQDRTAQVARVDAARVHLDATRAWAALRHADLLATRPGAS